MIGEFVIVRCRDAGVHTGYLKEQSGRAALLHEARRIWNWQGAFTLNEVANSGVAEESRISEAVPQILLLEACEIIPVPDEDARENLRRSRNGA